VPLKEILRRVIAYWTAELPIGAAAARNLLAYQTATPMVVH